MNDDFPDDDFSASERRRLRKLMRDEDRRGYTVKVVLTALAYVGGAATFFLAFKDGIAAFFRGLGKG